MKKVISTFLAILSLAILSSAPGQSAKKIFVTDLLGRKVANGMYIVKPLPFPPLNQGMTARTIAATNAPMKNMSVTESGVYLDYSDTGFLLMIKGRISPDKKTFLVDMGSPGERIWFETNNCMFNEIISPLGLWLEGGGNYANCGPAIRIGQKDGIISAEYANFIVRQSMGIGTNEYDVTSALTVNGPIATTFETADAPSISITDNMSAIDLSHPNPVVKLPPAQKCKGRELSFVCSGPCLAYSADNNVILPGTSAPQSVILSADWIWADLKSNGKNWKMTRRGK
jgi:hypothetical protein